MLVPDRSSDTLWAHKVEGVAMENERELNTGEAEKNALMPYVAPAIETLGESLSALLSSAVVCKDPEGVPPDLT